MGKSRQLNKERVIQAAAALANEQGTIETLSLKELAAVLDIRVPSLYNHIDGSEGLRHDLTIYGARELLAHLRQASFGKVGREAIMSMAAAMRRFAHEQPAIYPLTIRAPQIDDIELTQLAQELVQLLLLTLTSFGLQEEDALHAIRGIRAIIHGFIAIELAGGYELALDKDESFRRLLETYLDGVAGPW